MNTKLISQSALSIIDQYLNFRVEKAICSIPYYNNKNLKLRAKLKVNVGKGSPKEIFDEVRDISILEQVDLKSFDGIALKKFLVIHDIGVDCSGLAYYILNEESLSLGKGTIDRHLAFPLSMGIIGKIRSKMRPIENAGVTTLAHEKNSNVILISKAEPGDIVTLISQSQEHIRDHILIIHQIEYQNFIPTTLHYTHAIAWPTDGEYGHGVRQGKIEIVDPLKPLTEQRWIEAEKIGSENYTRERASKSLTELRRLNWL